MRKIHVWFYNVSILWGKIDRQFLPKEILKMVICCPFFSLTWCPIHESFTEFSLAESVARVLFFHAIRLKKIGIWLINSIIQLAFISNWNIANATVDRNDFKSQIIE